MTSFLFLIANLVTTSKALVPSSVALVSACSTLHHLYMVMSRIAPRCLAVTVAATCPTATATTGTLTFSHKDCNNFQSFDFSVWSGHRHSLGRARRQSLRAKLSGGLCMMGRN